MNRLLGPIPPSALHLVVDMQELFRSHSEWGTPALTRIIPAIAQLVKARPGQTYFSRFIPARNADEASGAWQRYYRRWSSVTLDALGTGMVDIVPELQPLAKHLVDKVGYSAMGNASFRQTVLAQKDPCLIVSGVETDVCVLATVMEAMEAGVRIVLPTDALASSSESCHDRALGILHDRFDDQIELGTVEEILAVWQ
jgi:nicotinamidase-related amidase